MTWLKIVFFYYEPPSGGFRVARRQFNFSLYVIITLPKLEIQGVKGLNTNLLKKLNITRKNLKT